MNLVGCWNKCHSGNELGRQGLSVWSLVVRRRLDANSVLISDNAFLSEASYLFLLPFCLALGVLSAGVQSMEGLQRMLTCNTASLRAANSGFSACIFLIISSTSAASFAAFSLTNSASLFSFSTLARKAAIRRSLSRRWRSAHSRLSFIF